MVRSDWQRIEAWGSENAPAMLEDLNPPASDEAIFVLEAQLGVRLPVEFTESLKIHDGESDGWPCKVFADCGAYLGTDRIAKEWNQRLRIATDMSRDESSDSDREEQVRLGIIDVEGPVKPRLFLRTWIPIMDCNGDIFWALDFSPSEGGDMGQVIKVDWEACSWKVVSRSFGDFLSDYADRLCAGEYDVVEGYPTMEGDA